MPKMLSGTQFQRISTHLILFLISSQDVNSLKPFLFLGNMKLRQNWLWGFRNLLEKLSYHYWDKAKKIWYKEPWFDGAWKVSLRLFCPYHNNHGLSNIWWWLQIPSIRKLLQLQISNFEIPLRYHLSADLQEASLKQYMMNLIEYLLTTSIKIYR